MRLILSAWTKAMLALPLAFFGLAGCHDSVSPPPDSASGEVVVNSVSLYYEDLDVPTGYRAAVSARIVTSPRIPLTPLIQWASSDPTVATIAQEQPLTALVTALSPGRTTISATVGGKTSSVEIAVYEDTPRTAEHPFFWTPEAGMSDLGVLPGTTDCRPSGINGSDQIVGYCKGTGTGQAFIWSPATGMTAIGGWPNGGDAHPTGINDAGQIIGYTPGPHGFIWTAADGAVDLGSIGAFQISTPLSISASGIVVGVSGKVFRWTAASGMTDLPITASYGAALDVNDAGDVVGYMGSPQDDNTVRAVSWTADKELHQVYGPPSKAVGINDSRQVAGTASLITAFVWTQESGMHELGTLPRTTFSQSVGINNVGQIAGNSNTHFVYHVFVWNEVSGMTNLGVLAGKSGCFATAINDSGHVIGYCF